MRNHSQQSNSLYNIHFTIRAMCDDFVNQIDFNQCGPVLLGTSIMNSFFRYIHVLYTVRHTQDVLIIATFPDFIYNFHFHGHFLGGSCVSGIDSKG